MGAVQSHDWAGFEATGGKQAWDELLRVHGQVADQERMFQLAVAQGVQWRCKQAVTADALQHATSATTAFEFRLGEKTQDKSHVVEHLRLLLWHICGRPHPPAVHPSGPGQAPPHPAQQQAPITALTDHLVAHIGSFCDEETRRAASEAHHCFHAIHQSCTSHRWAGSTTAAWFNSQSVPAPVRGKAWCRRDLPPMADRFLDLLQRKPRLQSLAFTLPADLSLQRPWFDACAEGLSIIAQYAEVQVSIYGALTDAGIIAAFSLAMQRASWAVSVAEAGVSAGLSAAEAGVSGGLSAAGAGVDGGPSAAIAPAVGQPLQQPPAHLWPPNDPRVAEFMMSVAHFKDQVQRHRQGRAGGSTSTSGASVLRATPHLRFAVLRCRDWAVAAAAVASMRAGQLSVGALPVGAPLRSPQDVQSLQSICQPPSLAQVVEQVLVGVKQGELWHTVEEEYLAALAVIPSLTVQYVDAPERCMPDQAPLPLVVRCATEVVLPVTSSASVAYIARMCAQSVRLRRVQVLTVCGYDVAAKCKLMRQLGAQMPARVQVMLSDAALRSPDVIQLALALHTTPPPSPPPPQPGSTHSTSAAAGGHQRHQQAPCTRAVGFNVCSHADAACAALAWHHIRAALQQQPGQGHAALSRMKLPAHDFAPYQDALAMLAKHDRALHAKWVLLHPPAAPAATL